MTYGRAQLDVKKTFRDWLTFQRDLIDIAVEEGFTRDQAVEMLKAYFLSEIAVSLKNISHTAEKVVLSL